MIRLETRRTLAYIYTLFGSESPFGMGVSGRRPPSLLCGAPTVLKGGEAVVRITGMRGNTLPEKGEVAEEMAAAVTRPGETVCCTDGIWASAGTEAESGRSSGAKGALHWASKDSGSTHHLPCVISGVVAALQTFQTSCHNKQNLQPSNCTRMATARPRLGRPAEHGRMPQRPGALSAARKAFWHDHTASIQRDTRQTWANVN